MWTHHHLSCLLTTLPGHTEGILPKGPYLPCVSMAGRALLPGYRWYMQHNADLSKSDILWADWSDLLAVNCLSGIPIGCITYGITVFRAISAATNIIMYHLTTSVLPKLLMTPIRIPILRIFGARASTTYWTACLSIDDTILQHTTFHLIHNLHLGESLGP